MADLSLPARDSVAAQAELFRRAAKKGMTIPIIAKRSDLSVSTMRGWATGTAMPAWALGALKEAGVPDHLLTLVTEPFAVSVVSDPEDDGGDLDTAAHDALEFSAAVAAARHPRSPGGLAIVPQEIVVITPKMERACASMRRAGRAA